MPPFSDARLQYRSEGKACFAFPFMPYGWYWYETPEKAPSSDPKYGIEAFSSCLESQDVFLDSLRRSRIFKRVHLVNDPEREKPGDVIIRGKVIESYYGEKLWTYGLSVAGGVLWLFGAPVATVSEGYAVEITLLIRKPEAEPVPVWTFRCAKEVNIHHGIYYRTPRFDKPALARKYRSLRRYLAEVVAAEFVRVLEAKLHDDPHLFER